MNNKKSEELKKIFKLEQENRRLRKKINELEKTIENKPTKKDKSGQCPNCSEGTLGEDIWGPYVVILCDTCNYRKTVKKELSEKKVQHKNKASGGS